MFSNYLLIGAGISLIILIICIIISNKIPSWVPTAFLLLTIGLGVAGAYIQFFGKTCPDCGVRNYAFAERCMGCSHLFLSRCENCGTALQEGTTECPTCHRVVTEDGKVAWGYSNGLPR